jgi:adenine-specific DNA-methyltransferase
MKPGYSVPLTVEFLKANPYLVLDTHHFSEDFKRRLLASFDNLDEQCDGLLIHSENFQALNLLLEGYRGKVKCIYIDPPYNTGHDEFTYKDDYQHSSWLTMLTDRLSLAHAILRTDGSIFVSLDDKEQARLKLVMDAVFGHDNFLANIVWEKVHTRKNSARYFSVSHDYILAYAKLKSQWDRILLPREDTSAYSNPDNDPKGPWKPDPVYANNPYDADYVITKPNGVTLRPPPGQYWRFSEETFKAKVAKGEVLWGEGDSYPMIKRYLSEVQQGLVPTTLFARDFAGDNMVANAELKALFGEGRAISYPKPTILIKRIAQITTRPRTGDVTLDFFAGSGTTAHAVINLNREDGGRRKYILVEMGEYFDTVLVPRIKKVVYSKDWKDGKPASREGISHMFKILRLESYEDTLNNLELRRTEVQQSLLEQHSDFREDYMLHYMLDVESRGSPSLLDLDRFEDPFNYKLNIATGTAGETKPTAVDLVETLNYQIGLRVRTMDHVRGAWVVTGTNPQDERVLILWRNIKEMDNDKLDDWFQMQGYNTKDQEYDVIYVNGDNNLENLKRPDQTWKVRIIEEEFLQRMFDVRDV